MEESDSTNEVTPYELATLASRICPEGCTTDPKQAIAAAERLLREAEAAIDSAYTEQLAKEWTMEESQAPRINWVRALKEITGQGRRDRAVERFLAFIGHGLPGKSKQRLDAYKRDGFTEEEIYFLHRHFMRWLKEPKRKKGKQGRRITGHDGRLRTSLGRLLPTKPRKLA